ncbi:MAG: ParA family protein [Brevibacterium aurantiacum]|uniref:ParA family protein n=1 Tax=Brevibacterium aurantiacum TaxID=273384 RepID=UPI000DF284E1|nr:ParA family protein [Brevibacterium aurantiacum]RCS87920.1 ParA family protein [Brevibacterium aurantiacum]RCS93478.1 ParA family protein [Brevibacterium aurantiacum]
MTKIFAISNQKGGVGKSTTTYHLGRAAVTQGRRVLVVDLDPQGNSTAALAEIDADQVGLADVLSARAPETATDVIIPSIWEGLDVLPTSGATLELVRDELIIAGAGREGRLRDALTTVASSYDLVLIDCPPSLDQLTINGLTAAEAVIVVTQAKKWSLDGLARLLDTIELTRRYYNPALAIAGVMMNQVERSTLADAHWIRELKSAVGAREIPLFEPAIPKSVTLSDSLEAAVGLDEWGTSKANDLHHLYTTHLTRLEGQTIG